MSQSWLDFANKTAQDLIGQRAAALSAPASPVVASTSSGTAYAEGQAAATATQHTILYAGAAVAAALVLFLVLKK